MKPTSKSAGSCGGGWSAELCCYIYTDHKFSSFKIMGLLEYLCLFFFFIIISIRNYPQLQTMPVYPPGSTVRVMHDYTPPKEHCLKLTVGETIQVVESKNMDSEWVAGKNKDGKVGFFPALYVELLVVNKVTKENPETVETIVEKKKTSTSAAASPPAPAAPAAPAASATAVKIEKK